MEKDFKLDDKVRVTKKGTTYGFEGVVYQVLFGDLGVAERYGVKFGEGEFKFGDKLSFYTDDELELVWRDNFVSDNMINEVLANAPKKFDNDAVNHPSYYTSHPSGIECIEVAKYFDFCVGCAIKYLWRNGLKQDADKSAKDKQIEDLKKAIWYINAEIDLLNKN